MRILADLTTHAANHWPLIGHRADNDQICNIHRLRSHSPVCRSPPSAEAVHRGCPEIGHLLELHFADANCPR